MAAQPWWVISVSTQNGKPWQAISFQGTQAAAQSKSQGGIIAGPFLTEAQAAAAGNYWSSGTHHQFTDNPSLSSANPVKNTTAAAAAIGTSAVNTVTNAVAPWASGLTQFLANITSSTLWIRIAKVVAGGVLMIVGLAHITGASNAVALAARKAPLPV